MKKVVVILSLIMSLFLFAACNSNADSFAQKHDFRNVDFGMSTIELLEIEGEPDDESSLGTDISIYKYYNKEAFGVSNATVTYYVDEKGIVMAYAIYNNDYVDDKSYIIEYNTIKEKLTAVWGEPESVTENNSEFNFECIWDNNNKNLKLNKDKNDWITFQVSAVRSDYFENPITFTAQTAE